MMTNSNLLPALWFRGHIRPKRSIFTGWQWALATGLAIGGTAVLITFIAP